MARQLLWRRRLERILRESCMRLEEMIRSFNRPLAGRQRRIQCDYETYADLLAEGKYEALYNSCNEATRNRVFTLIQILAENHRATIRHYFYRAASSGLVENDQAGYGAVCRDIGKLRDLQIIPYDWIADNTRYRQGGCAYYEQSPEEAFRSTQLLWSFSREFWLDQKDHVEILVEKDAMVGVLEGVCRTYDVALSVLRGQASDTFVYEVGTEWTRLVGRWREQGKSKVIYAYYLGDHDPSGFSIESSFQSRIKSHLSGVRWNWQRLAVSPEDFANPAYLPLKIKGGDKLGPDYIRRYGDKAVEVDAIPPREIKSRLKEVIKQHINGDLEELTKETVRIGRARIEMALESLGLTDKQIKKAISSVEHLPTEAEARKWLVESKQEQNNEEEDNETRDSN